MEYANKQDVERLLFSSEVSSYKIAKETGISEATLNKYRRGESDIDNMTFGNAIKLQNLFLKLKEENKLTKQLTREESFAKALATLDAVSKRRFEKNKPTVSILYRSDLAIKPMTTFTRAHKDVMQYGERFDGIDIELMDRVTGYIGTMSFDDYNDEPLEPSYMVHFSKEAVELEGLVEALEKNKK